MAREENVIDFKVSKLERDIKRILHHEPTPEDEIRKRFAVRRMMAMIEEDLNDSSLIQSPELRIIGAEELIEVDEGEEVEIPPES